MTRPTQDPSHSPKREILQKIHAAAQAFQITALDRQIEVCEGMLHKDPWIDVAVLGQFKSGKSSFINHLIGREILPVGVIPVTSVITRICHGEQERARVCFFDETSIEIDLSELKYYTSEAENPGNVKNVAIVDIDLPALSEFSGIRLVDTPGLGSVFKVHKEVSGNWLPEVGAAIVAVSVERPLSEHDINLIENLLHVTPRIALLLTKVDILKPQEQNEVMQFFRQTLKKELDHDFPLFLYSTREHTQRYNDSLAAALFYPLSLNREQEFTSILGHKMRFLIKGCLGYLDIALKSSMALDQDRDRLRNRIIDEKVGYETVKDELGVIARENQRRTRPLLMKHLDRFQQPLTEKLIQTLEVELPTWQGNLWTLTRRFEGWLTEHMTDEMQRLSETEHHHFFGTLQKAHMSLSRSLETFRMLLSDNVEKVLGLTLPDADWRIDVDTPLKPDIKVLYAFDFHFDLLWFLIPMVIFRRLFERHFIGEIPKTVVINLSRLAAQWEDTINKAIDAMRRQAASYIREETLTIEAMLSRPQGQTGEIAKLISELQGHLIET